MYGRLVEVEGIDPAKREEVLQTIRERVIPALQQIDGFAGFISLVDEETQRGRSIVLWETKESAGEAERQMKSVREETVRQAGGTVRSADLYEAPIVDVRTGVHA
jgi:heme-degrading monooxygenase HmoA